MTAERVRRLLLVGFMASGKTTVGRRLAERLGWRFVDFDDVVEEEAGSSIADVFAGQGEAAFRALEDAVARRLLQEDEVVLGSGGGWAAVPGRIGGAPAGTATVWLRVSAEEAVRRAQAAGGRERPLLAVETPLERARELLGCREPFYAVSRWTVDTEGRSPIEVCEEIEALMLDSAGATDPR